MGGHDHAHDHAHGAHGHSQDHGHEHEDPMVCIKVGIVFISVFVALFFIAL